MTKTPELIDTLADCAEPVRRLRPPLLRAAIWLGIAAIVLVIIGIGHGLRPDIGERLRQPTFIVAMMGALATGILAAIASFKISLPDRSSAWLLLPLPALLVWVSTIGYGCLFDWVSIDVNGVRMGEAVRCFATLLLTSVPLSIAMLLMVRYAALLRPAPVSIMAGLAVAALTSFALSLFHNLDATIMILIWNLGSAVLIAGLAALFGRSLLGFAAARLVTAPNRQ